MIRMRMETPIKVEPRGLPTLRRREDEEETWKAAESKPGEVTYGGRMTDPEPVVGSKALDCVVAALFKRKS